MSVSVCDKDTRLTGEIVSGWRRWHHLVRNCFRLGRVYVIAKSLCDVQFNYINDQSRHNYSLWAKSRESEHRAAKLLAGSSTKQLVTAGVPPHAEQTAWSAPHYGAVRHTSEVSARTTARQDTHFDCVNFSDRWWVHNQVKFDPFQTSERLQAFGESHFYDILTLNTSLPKH